jgi:hypothetical protein
MLLVYREKGGGLVTDPEKELCKNTCKTKKASWVVKQTQCLLQQQK